MSYCHYCGREETHGHCVCLATTPIPKWQVWILYIILVMIPPSILSFIAKENSIWTIHYLFYGGLILLGVLLLVTLLHITIKKPYLALFFGCHQRTTRSFHILGYYLPLCARCTGIYLGIVIFPWIMMMNRIPIYWYLIGGIPLIVDGLLQKQQILQSNNFRRAITGFLFGGTLITLFTLYQVIVVWGAQSLLTLLP